MRDAGPALSEAGLRWRREVVRLTRGAVRAGGALEVTVWFLEVPDGDIPLDALGAILDAGERERAKRFRRKRDRRLFVTAHGGLRLVLGAALDVEPAALELRADAGGKPRLSGRPAGSSVQFSLAHAGEWAAVATADGREVGVDLEPLEGRSGQVEEVAEAILHPREARAVAALPASERIRALLRVWTRKEAVLKAFGWGLDFPLRELEVGVEGLLGVRIVRVPSPAGAAGRAFLDDLPAPQGYVGAVAVVPPSGSPGPEDGRA